MSNISIAMVSTARMTLCHGVPIFLPLEDRAGPDAEPATYCRWHRNLALGGKLRYCDRHSVHYRAVMCRPQVPTRIADVRPVTRRGLVKSTRLEKPIHHHAHHVLRIARLPKYVVASHLQRSEPRRHLHFTKPSTVHIENAPCTRRDGHT